MATFVFDDDITRDDFRELTRVYFDARAPAYNSPFHQRLADDLLRHYPPPPGGAVLDIAAGTGAVALGAAAMLSSAAASGAPPGRVVAHDLSAGMLAVASAAAAAGGYAPIFRTVQGHAEDLGGLPDATYDAVYCCSALAYFVCVPAAVAAAARVTRGGGFVALQSFSGDSFVAGVAMAAAVRRVLGAAAGGRVFSLPLAATAGPAECVALLRGAGLERVRVVEVDLTRRVDAGELTAAYARLSPNSFCVRLNALDARTRAAVQAAYVGIIEGLRGADGCVEDRQLSFNVVGYKPRA